MECNKDEAIRAKCIAEEKMQINDFGGACKIARKAQQLYPELENIYQLIMVCNVHCSAHNRICGSEMDWYGILQVERLANEGTIKKQYRKLALLLHPDKNKFPGAESAFKLIGEANMVLSDEGKRSLYDSKCRVLMRTASMKTPSRKQYPTTQRAFWTSCPFCNMSYQYYREFLNRALLCQNCAKPFTACEVGPRSNIVQSPGSIQVEPGNNTGDFLPSYKGYQRNFSRKTVVPTPVVPTPVSGTGSTCEVVGTKGFGTSTNTNRKRRKLVVESSESFDTAKDAIQENVGSSADVLYNGSLGGVDVSCPGGEVLSRGSKEDVSILKDGINTEGSFNAEASEIKLSDSESDSDSCCEPDPTFYDCPDSEFHDFDNDREENCFSVDQIWACYDTTDGMPRFYARIRKVFSLGFKLRITWLESRPEGQNEINWCNADLPVSCGKFIHGTSEETMDRLTFSHQIQFEKGSGRWSYMIYPRKGETWGLFKDWDINWSCDPESHRKYKFEIVEVLCDFAGGDGLRVAYLDKVEGFVSVFQRITREGIFSVSILPTQLLRFSHRIPSFKLMGTEREGIHEGAFELDPASLPW